MTIQERVRVGDRPELDVDVASGSVEVRVGASDEIVVVVGGNEDLWEIDQVGDSVSIRPRSRWHDTSATSVSGALEVNEVGGRLTATTASGDVRVRHLTGDVEIGTTSGDVRIDHFDGSEASIRSVSGDVELGLPSGIRLEPSFD